MGNKGAVLAFYPGSTITFYTFPKTHLFCFTVLPLMVKLIATLKVNQVAVWEVPDQITMCCG